MGELVITTLQKEGGPLIRYRTHDLTRLIPGDCPCGSPFPRHDRIQGRTDDMVKVKGVNIYPAQMDGILKKIEGVSSEYLIEINHFDGKDEIELCMEVENGADMAAIEEAVFEQVRRTIGVRIRVKAFALGALPRSEKKTKRIKDNRQN
jgi:phenylacetate-CoA ligase